MPSRCTLGGDAGLLLDRPRGPVLPEYTYNVIRKINTKNDLMCPIVGFMIFRCGLGEAGVYVVILDFTGVYGDQGV
jgi:hypothetical protein